MKKLWKIIGSKKVESDLLSTDSRQASKSKNIIAKKINRLCRTSDFCDPEDNNKKHKHHLLILIGERLDSYRESLKLCYQLEIVDEVFVSTFKSCNENSTFYDLLHDELVDDNYFGSLDQCNNCPSEMEIVNESKKMLDKWKKICII